ncbi:MAG TPA: adenylyltransferase/cytidyltransferase family protein [Dermatophilaceae bacterium]|nr:adenylyltransferase/cytidyltransferase family protein [Dermatophilaceae bacterium]
MSHRTVVTFGTHDVFHVGHLRLLLRAAALGDRLVVGVSADARNVAKKGDRGHRAHRHRWRRRLTAAHPLPGPDRRPTAARSPPDRRLTAPADRPVPAGGHRNTDVKHGPEPKYIPVISPGVLRARRDQWENGGRPMLQ